MALDVQAPAGALDFGTPTIPGLEALELIGQGAFSFVYRARRGTEYFAVKLQKTQFASPTARRQAWREAAAIARLRHPGVCRVFSVGEVEQRIYIVMEFLGGRTLAEHFRGQRASEAETRRIGLAIAEALTVVHRTGLVHGDLKPRNVLLDDAQRPKLIDFGLVTHSTGDDHDKAVFGTLQYMSPEQSGTLKRPVDARSDLYALGVVLYELAVGELPFTTGDVGELIRQHATVVPAAARQANPSISESLSRVIARLLAKDPDDRYQTAQALVHDLAAHQNAIGDASVPLVDRLQLMSGEGLRDLPLVGTLDVVHRLGTARPENDEASCCATMLLGPSGSGKSRILRELIREAHGRGTMSLTGRCYASDGAPYGAVRQWVEDLAAYVDDAPDVNGLRRQISQAAGEGAIYLPNLSDRFASLLSREKRAVEETPVADSVPRAMREFLTALARQRGGLLLVLDDVQWLDEASRSVLSQFNADEMPAALGTHSAVGARGVSGKNGVFGAEGVFRTEGVSFERAPLRIVLAGEVDSPRATDPSATGIDEIKTTMAHCLAAPVEVPRLDRSDVRALTANYLNTDEVTEDLIDRLTTRSGGNALAALEYSKALLEEGHLRYTWDHWTLQPGGLEALSVSEHLLDVATRRLSTLEPDDLRVLSLAALLGVRFRRELLEAVTLMPSAVIDRAIASAHTAQVIESLGRLDYGFVHERIRASLLTRIDASERALLHARIARAQSLDMAVEADPSAVPASMVYDVAQHYFAARSLGTFEVLSEGFRVNWVAAQTAHRAYVFEHAYDLYGRAQEIAALLSAFGFDTPALFLADHGRAAAAVARSEEAFQLLTSAKDKADDAVVRATCCAELAELLTAAPELAGVHLASGLAALGAAYPGASVFHLAGTLFRWLWGFLVPPRALPDEVHDSDSDLGSTQQAFSETQAASGDRARLRNRLLCRLYTHVGFVEFYRLRLLAMIQGPMLVRGPAMRLGRSAYLAKWMASSSAFLEVFKLRGWADALRTRALELCGELADPAATGTALLHAGYGLEIRGRPLEAARRFEVCAYRYARWMAPWDRVAGLATFASNLHMRGLCREVIDVLRLIDAEHAKSGTFVPEGKSAVGDCIAQPAARLLRREGAAYTSTADDPGYRRLGRWMKALVVGYETLHRLYNGGPFDDLDALRDEFLRQRIDLKTNHQVLHFPIAETWIRLRQWAEARAAREQSPAIERAYRQSYRQSVRRLRQGAGHPSVRGHLLAAEARRHALLGENAAALRMLGRAETLAQTHENPWVLYEVWVTRAELFRNQGLPQAATREAQRALDIARRHEWIERANSVASGFDLEAATHRLSGRSVSLSTRPVDASGLHTSRSLSALLEVSLASTAVLDPSRQSRLVLDAVVRLLAADRGLLFLVGGPLRGPSREAPHESLAEPDVGRSPRAAKSIPLEYFVGRTKEGADVGADASYSLSVVEDVARTRAPVVVGGPDAQTVRATESILVHDLRSVMAVPLLLRDELLGVVYVDNRLARGMFTESDVEVFSAIANHVAIALETARTVKLEAEVEAERAQRQLSERLSSVVSSLGSTLELKTVLENILDHLTHLVPFRRAAVLLTEANSGDADPDAYALRIAAHRGFRDGDIDVDRLIRPAEDGGSRDLLDADVFVVLHDHFPYPHRSDPRPGAVLLGVPLVVREQTLGLLTVEIEGEDGAAELGEHKTQVATMFAGHAAIAVENARLFEEVRRQAISDSLTGLFTRRHFFSLMRHEISLARRNARPFGLVMLDVDHFKRINDTYGHAVGDQVLKEVARRLQARLRESDVLGRYGGEEFALMLIDTGLAQAVAVAETLRSLIADAPFETDAGAVPVTISLGVASSELDSIDDAQAQPGQALLVLADQALYRAKTSGRNRVAQAT
ncbi:MAG: diguanylate cyclase [Deltaproteobacteria bacterium]|nr:diguanylate cyclase [Deltaproteobacteria bacterium]